MTTPFNCGKFVSAKIFSLCGKNPTERTPAQTALLAQLRAAAPHEPGTVPSIWSITLDGLPDDISSGYRQKIEAVIHIALTQYATHQQGKTDPMHVPGETFGRAVRRLADQIGAGDDIYTSPVYRRFTALASARGMNAILAHLRGIIGQLRSHNISLDYGSLANDLYQLLTPGQERNVVRRWGRDFHHSIVTTSGENHDDLH